MFHARGAVGAAFDAGLMTSDAGALLIGAADRAIALVERFAGCFIVTSLKRAEMGARHLYEDTYCARGDTENRIKECQLDLYAIAPRPPLCAPTSCAFTSLQWPTCSCARCGASTRKARELR
jgi:hypothetical protein